MVKGGSLIKSKLRVLKYFPVNLSTVKWSRVLCANKFQSIYEKAVAQTSGFGGYEDEWGVG